MALSTYADLQASIITWAWRDGDTEFANAVPDFITGCEQLLNYGSDAVPALRTSDMETTATVTLTSGVGTLPTDYLQYRAIVGNGNGLTNDLEVKDPGWLAQQFPNGVTSYNGRFCSITSTSTLTVYDASVSSITLTYYAKIPALSNSNTTNWLLTKAPMVYLYGSLLQAAPFMMDDARMQTFGTLFQQAMSGLRNSDMGARMARPVARVRGATP